MAHLKLEKSMALFAEAEKIVPGGYQAPQNPYFYGMGASPAFLARGKGCRVWDVDGNEYIDFMCGLGAIVLGMGHPRVDEAARAQLELGDCMTFPTERWIELARALAERIPNMDWVNFGKNGSDVTSYMAQVARAHTGKPGLVMIEHAYHGSHFWAQTPGTPGVPPEYQQHVHTFHFNDLEEFEDVVGKNKGTLAAVFLTPVRHDVASDQELPEPGFFARIREICDREGMLVLLDDVRCGFRYHPDGSDPYFGIGADMIAFGKAVANGYPIAMAMGKKELMDAARTFMFIGTHFYSSVPMAASLACLQEIKESGAVDHMLKMGETLRDGFIEAANEHGLSIRYSGHPAMPLMLFDDDPLFEKSRLFSAEALSRGVIFHPIHNWFLSAAHQKKDIEQAIEIVDICMKQVAAAG